MPIFQTGVRPLRDANVRCRAAGRFRRTALAVGVVGLTAGSGVLTAGSAFGSSTLQPGNLIFTPASGVSSATPTWHTTDGCPVGYRGSAQMSIFNSKGVLLSRISPAVYSGLAGSFSGTLDGKLSAILKFAQIKAGGQLLFAVGCYSGPGGTGSVQWVQSAVVGLASNGTSYSATVGSASTAQSLTGAGSAGSAQSATGSGSGQSASSSGHAASTTATDTSDSSSQVQAAWIAGLCGLVVATVGFVWVRRRNRSRLL